MPTDALAAHDRYLIRKKVFKLFGGAFHVYDESGALLLYSRQKAFRLKEDLRLFTDETMATEVMRIRARSVIDFGATYDVIDTASGSITGEAIGSVRRRGLKSMVRDNWELYDAGGRLIATVVEESSALAILRRVVDLASLLVPQQFHVQMDGVKVGHFKQRFNPFVQKLEVDFSYDGEHRLDRRLGLAAAILIAAIEGRQG